MKKERKHKNINEIGWALFSDDLYELRRNPFKIFRHIKIYFSRLKCLKKYGCAESAFFETSAWFMIVMKEILTKYRYRRSGTPIFIEDYNLWEEDGSSERNEKTYDDYLDKMLDLLNKMDEDYYWTGEEWTDDRHEKMEAAKNEFMKMFSDIFYNLWD